MTNGNVPGTGASPDLGRLVQVRCPGHGRGTGFLVGDGLVLTAAHVVAGSAAGAEVQVREFDTTGADVPWVRAQVATAGAAAEALDVALLRVSGALPVPVTPAPEWGRISGTRPVSVFAVGFPKAMKDDAGPDSHVVRGVVDPAQGARQFAAGVATLAITDGSIVPRRGAGRAWPWSGASGAAVFAAHSGQLIGVLTNDFDIAEDASVLTLTLVAAVDGLADLAGAAVTPLAPDGLSPEVPVLPAAAVGVPDRAVRPRGGLGAPPEVFVGREDELAALDAALAAGASVITQNQAVTGLGGIGKSTLAAYWAAGHDADFNPIWWVNAEIPEQIDASLAGLARELHLPLQAESDDQAATWCRDWLHSHSGWLLVLDNVTAPGDVKTLIKDCPVGRFLLTSRTTVGWKNIAEPLRLDVLSPQEAVELLCRLAGKDYLDGAEQLCQDLGFLPLAIELAAAYLEETGVSARAYLRLLTANQSHEVLAWTPVHGDARRTVARVWQVSLDRIRERFGDLPEQLLQILAWYRPDDIPVDLLYGFDGIGEAQVDQALGRLAAYALLTRKYHGVVSVHRLVQAVARAGDGAAAARDTAVLALLAALPDIDQRAGWPVWRRLFPHLEALIAHTDPGDDNEATALLLTYAALFLNGQGQPQRAIPLHQRALTGATRILGDDHPDTFTSRINLAHAYQSAGDLGRAIPLLEQTLTDQLRVLGPDDPGTFTSRNNLANAYESAGDLNRAIPLFEQNLTDQQRVLGPDHQHTLTTRNNLAAAYESAGNLERAIPLFQQTLTDELRVLGPDHPETLRCRNNLAHAYESAGDLDRAVLHYSHSLVGHQRVLGADHPNTLIVRNNFAGIYHSAGNLGRAIAEYEQTLTDCERVLGRNHPITQWVQHNMEVALAQADRPA